MHPHNLTPGLDLVNEIILKTFNFKLFHHSFIIHSFIKARFTYFNYTKLASSLGSINEII